MTPDTTIAVQKPADLVDATPYVIGFHPTESLVVLGISGGRVFFGARYDLPPPDGDDNIVHLGAVVAAQKARCVALLAYGPPAAADAVVEQALDVFDAFRVRVLEAIRVHEGRWWSYFCSDAVCCPAEGTPFDTATSLIAAEATYRGQVVLPNRQALVTQVAPVEGEARAAMTAATERARVALDPLLADNERAVRRAGRLAVREAEKRYRSGRALTNDEVAWLGALLLNPDVNEYTLSRLGDEEWRLTLWTDVLRRVEPAYVPAAGSVLGYLAWRAGQGALARVAVDRALHADPHHSMSALLDEVLGLGIGPHAMAALDSPPRQTVFRPADPTLPFATPHAKASPPRSRSEPSTGNSPTRHRDDSASGRTGSPAAGSAGSPSSDHAGSSPSGAADSPPSGRAGSSSSGSAGSSSSGRAGSPRSGSAGSSSSGRAGSPRSGSAGSPPLGHAGSPRSGSGGSPSSGRAGLPPPASADSPPSAGVGSPAPGRAGSVAPGVVGSSAPGEAGSLAPGGVGSPPPGRVGSATSSGAGPAALHGADTSLTGEGRPAPSRGGPPTPEPDRPPRRERRLRRVLRRRSQ